MTAEERKEGVLRRLDAYSKKIQEAAANNGDGKFPIENTKEHRAELIRTNHLLHISQLMGAEGKETMQKRVLFNMAKEMIVKVKDAEERRRAAVAMNLIDGHVAAWNIVHYYYEKATKVLCQMMVSFMDCIIQETGENSILYDEMDTAGYLDLVDETVVLNVEYIDSYYYLCSYDFCTMKLGDYVGVPEYGKLIKEHERLIENGNPQRVTKILQRLKKICRENERNEVQKLEMAYIPEPEYNEEKFERCYRTVIEGYGSETEAMASFPSLVAQVSLLYQRDEKE